MTRKDCNWGSTLLRSMSIQFSFPACIAAIRVPAETQNGVAKNRQDTRWESKWVIAGQRLSWGHICFGGSTLSIIRQTLYCETREKGSAAILTPDSFFGWGTSRQRHKKYKKVIKGNHLLVFQQKSAPPYAIYFHQIQPPWTVTVSEQYRPTNGGTIFPHTHTLSSLLSLFFTPDSDRSDGSFGR